MGLIEHGTTYIPLGTPCNICGIVFTGNESKEDFPNVIEVGPETQMVVHWSCLPSEVKVQVHQNQSRQNAMFN